MMIRFLSFFKIRLFALKFNIAVSILIKYIILAYSKNPLVLFKTSGFKIV